jgi:hypothetical protein
LNLKKLNKYKIESEMACCVDEDGKNPMMEINAGIQVSQVSQVLIRQDNKMQNTTRSQHKL